uniref:Uncharacterized protein n=1 Tax=Graphocephala atropunctata TaxID=36148 RepID=A0A1B6LII5_9HEMI
MTDYKCFGKCIKNCEKICQNPSDHTNKNCHLKRFCCCYAHSSCKFTEKEASPEVKVCEVCCCLLKNCVCLKKSQHRESRHKKLHNNKYLEKEKSPEQRLCELCCHLLKNCKCGSSSPQLTSGIRGPRTLCEDLPLYDERAHLIGYIKRGAVIDDPSCVRSRDLGLESGSVSEMALRQRQPTMDRSCMASCRYAEGVKSDNRAANVSCWTTRSAFDHATTGDRNIQHRKHKRNHCPCSK